MALTHYEYKDSMDEDLKPGRFYFSEPQKERLHKEFRQNKNPSTEWRQEIADELQVPVKKVHMWFGARRQKDRLAQEKRLRSSPVGKVSINPVMYDQYPASAFNEQYVTKISTSELLRTETLQKPLVFPSDPCFVKYSSEPLHVIKYEEPGHLSDSKPYEEPETDLKPSNYSDLNSNLEKEKAALEKLDTHDIVRHFLNLGQSFNELKMLFDQTEAKITKVKEESNFTDILSEAIEDSREKLLVETSEQWIDNNPYVPKGWSTKLNKNGSKRTPRRIFRDPSGRIFYSRRKAVDDMIQKNIYSDEEIRLMEESYPNHHSFMNEEEKVPDLNHYTGIDPSASITHSMSDHVAETNTDWNENDPGLPLGWKSKEHNGITMVKGPPPLNDVYLSRIAALKALLTNPTGNENDIEMFQRFFYSSGMDVESALANVDEVWKCDENLPNGWKYSHTIREAPNRNSGYKRLLSFLTEGGTKLPSSLAALDYLAGAGCPSKVQDKLRFFIKDSKLSEKKKSEQMKSNGTNSNIDLVSDQISSNENSDQASDEVLSVQKEPTYQYSEPLPNGFYEDPKSTLYPPFQMPAHYSEPRFPYYPPGSFLNNQYPQPVHGYPAPYTQYPGAHPHMPLPPLMSQYQYPGPPPVVPYTNHVMEQTEDQRKPSPRYTQPLIVPTQSHSAHESLKGVDTKKIKVEAPEPDAETKMDAVSDNLDISKLLAEGLIKIEVEETDNEEACLSKEDAQIKCTTNFDASSSGLKVEEPVSREEEDMCMEEGASALLGIVESTAQAEDMLVQDGVGESMDHDEVVKLTDQVALDESMMQDEVEEHIAQSGVEKPISHAEAEESTEKLELEEITSQVENVATGPIVHYEVEGSMIQENEESKEKMWNLEPMLLVEEQTVQVEGEELPVQNEATEFTSVDTEEQPFSRVEDKQQPLSQVEVQQPLSSVVVEKRLSQAEVEESISQVEQPISQVEQPISQVEQPISQVEQPISQAEQPISQVEQPISQAEQPISQAEKPISQAEQPISQVEQPISQVEQPISQAVVDESISQVEQPISQAVVDESISQVEQSISQVEKSIFQPISQTEIEQTTPLIEMPVSQCEVDQPVSNVDVAQTMSQVEIKQPMAEVEFEIEQPTLHVEIEQPKTQAEVPLSREDIVKSMSQGVFEQPMALVEPSLLHEDSVGTLGGFGMEPMSPDRKEPTSIKFGLQFGFYNDESFIRKVASETNNTIYKTALYEDAVDENRYSLSKSCLLVQDEEALKIPSHLSEHNYTVPHDKAPECVVACFEEEKSLILKEIESKSNEEETTILNEISLSSEADQIDSFCFDESISADDIADSSEWFQDAPQYKSNNLVTDYQGGVVSAVSGALEDSEQISSVVDEDLLEKDDIADVGEITATGEGQESGWTNGSLDDTKFESDEEELDAIQNMIKCQNEGILNDDTTLDESVREEEEINDFIQEFEVLEKETAHKEQIYESGVDSFCNSVGNIQTGTEPLPLVNFEYSQNTEAFVEKGPLYYEDDVDKPNSEKVIGENRGGRYEQDPSLPEGWKKATYFVKKTGMRLYRYLSPYGQKFTSRKLVVSFMKDKGFSQEDLDRAMDGTGTKSRRTRYTQDIAEEQDSMELTGRKVKKEIFITSVGDDRKRKWKSEVESGGVEENILSKNVVVKTEPSAESILEPVRKESRIGCAKDEDESSIGPKLSVDRNSFKQLAALFLKSPIPSNCDLANISKGTGVTAKDVKWWFIKIRHRVKVNKVMKDQVKNYLDSIRICHDVNGTISL